MDFDRYRIQYPPGWRLDHQIGSGGFGMVYKERIHRLGMFRPEVCAVKKINLGTLNITGDQQQYKREIAILASLHHEWFVEFFGWYETGDFLYIAMEYIELGDLGRYLGTPWSENDTKVVVEQLLMGLSVLHEAGIAHRDLKAQNVFPILFDNGCLRIKIGDFGISKLVPSYTNTSLRTALGLTGYSAPELMGHSGSYTNAVDLWSLGCLMYRMICGEDLFSTLDDLYNYKSSVLPFPRVRLCALGIGLNAIDFMQSLLQCNPAHRLTAIDSVSCSWIISGALGYNLSPGQIERILNSAQRPEYAILEESEFVLPQPGLLLEENAETVLPQSGHPATSLVPYKSSLALDDTFGLLNTPTGPFQTTLTGHSHWVRSVAFSPDGKRLASSSADHTIKLWDLSTQACEATLSGHYYLVASVAFSPDGKCIASASHSDIINFWGQSTEICQATLNGHCWPVLSVAYSPDGRFLAFASLDNTIKLWDTSSGAFRMTLTGHSGWVNSVAFSPDGERLATASFDRTIKLWDTSSGVFQMTLTGHSGWVNSVTFSPNGKYLASASSDNTIKLWDLYREECEATLRGHFHAVNSVAFSPGGACLASASADKTIKLWNLSTETCEVNLEGHSDDVNAVAFSPDGTWLASASKDETIKLWGPYTVYFNNF